MTTSMTIGEVAASAGLTASALRYYEEAGLIRPAGRDGGRRVYDPAVVQRLAVIALCQDSGFTIAEIRDFLAASHGRADWRRLAEAKRGELDQRIERAKTMRRLLEEVLACDCDGECELVSGAAERRRSRSR